MGTRSLTYVYGDELKEDPKPLINLYRQYDGYVEGHGAELADFLNGMYVVNGLGVQDQDKKIANGMGCFAAQLVAHFKDGAGQFYLNTPEVGIDCWQEYEYHIYSDRVIIKAYDEPIFLGTWQEFIDYVAEQVKLREAEAA